MMGLFKKRKLERAVHAASAALKAGHYREAVTHFDEALAIGGDQPAWLADKSLALQELGEFEAAVEACDRALACYPSPQPENPVYLQILLYKGNHFYFQRAYDRAVAVYDELLALAPTHRDGIKCKGLTLKNMEQLEAARKCFQRMLELDAGDAEAQKWLERLSK